MAYRPPPFHPFAWIVIGSFLLGDPLVGEEPVDMAALDFSGETVAFDCERCGEELGRVPVEFFQGWLEKLTMQRIGPVLALHYDRCR
jgi:hypothetical protein